MSRWLCQNTENLQILIVLEMAKKNVLKPSKEKQGMNGLKCNKTIFD